jgi:hypothetical protein
MKDSNSVGSMLVPPRSRMDILIDGVDTLMAKSKLEKNMQRH